MGWSQKEAALRLHILHKLHTLTETLFGKCDTAHLLVELHWDLLLFWRGLFESGSPTEACVCVRAWACMFMLLSLDKHTLVLFSWLWPISLNPMRVWRLQRGGKFQHSGCQWAEFRGAGIETRRDDVPSQESSVFPGRMVSQCLLLLATRKHSGGSRDCDQ